MTPERPASRASAPSRDSHAGPAPLPGWAALCFLVSGAAGLVYEVVWSKVLSQVMGNSLHAISTVVACFLAGLAIGAWWAARSQADPARAARRYARLEAGIAVLGAVSVPLLRALDPALGALAGSLGDGPAFLIARVALVALVLLPPTILMGATLPVLVGGLEPGRAGATLARLYAINTVGAVAGTVLAGFVLLPSVGLRASSWVAAALNVVAALAASRFARAASATPERTANAPFAAAEAAGARTVAGIALALGASGFAALLFQMAWVRLFANLLGSSTYSFSAVLGVYLAGLALGAGVIARPLARGGSLALFALLQAALAVAAAAVAWVFPLLPGGYLALVRGGEVGWGQLQFAQLGLVAAVVLVPCALLGAIFPLAIRLLGGAGARATGTGYALNTIGTITGAFAGGYWLVPKLGVLGTHVLALSLSAAIALAAALAAMRGRTARSLAAVALALVVLAGATAALAPRWNPQIMSAGVYRPARRLYLRDAAQGRAGSLVEAAAWRERVLLYEEGEHSSVLVTQDSLSGFVSLSLNGKVDASSGDMLTQVLLGLVPAAFADSGARTLVIGHGSGVTLAAALAAGAGATDLVELEPAVLRGAAFFHEKGRDPLADPRTRVHVEDGRTALARSREKWDLIVSEPSNPWLAGVNNLFTADFYRLARSRLKPGGVFCQWLQLYEISPETFGTILASFFATFPDGQAFVGTDVTDLVLCAMDSPRPLDWNRLRTDPVAYELLRARLPALDALAGYYLGPFTSLRPFAAGRPLNRDDLPIVEFAAPRDMVAEGVAHQRGQAGLRERLPEGRWADARAVFAGWTPERFWRARGEELARTGRERSARAVAEDARAEGRAAFADTLARAVQRTLDRREAVLRSQRAERLAAAGRFDEALRHLDEASRRDPESPAVWAILAETRRQAGDAAGTRAALDRALVLARGEQRFAPLLTAGFLAVSTGDPLGAARAFADAQPLRPSDPMASVYEARARFEGRDTTGAIAAFRRAAAIAPTHPEVLQAQRYLGL